MATYLIQIAFTAESFARLVETPENRFAAVIPLVERLGGRFVGSWMSFGEYDSVAVVEMPDEVAMKGFSMSVMAGGGARRERYELLPEGQPTTLTVGTRTARVIRDAAVLDSVIVTSFDFFKLHALEKEHSPIHSGFAYDDDFALVLPRWISRLPDLETQVTEIAEGESRNREALVNRLFEANRIGRWIGASVVAGEHTLIEPDSIGRFKARGTAVGTFTFFPIEMTGVRHHLNDEAQVSRLRELHEQGVDWIETDDPVRAIELLERV